MSTVRIFNTFGVGNFGITFAIHNFSSIKRKKIAIQNQKAIGDVIYIDKILDALLMMSSNRRSTIYNT